MFCIWATFHENDGHHENDEDDSDSNKQGAECWINGNHGNYPDPPTIAFLEKARETPKKTRVFLFAEPLKSLEKEVITHKKEGKIGKRKKQGIRKKQGLEGQGTEMTKTMEIQGANHRFPKPTGLETPERP